MTNTTAKPATAKTGNWSDADLKGLEGYQAGQNSAEQLQALCPAKSVAAIRSKLVSLGKYKKADEVPAADGTAKAAPAKKLATVCAIETLLSLPVGSLATFEKASKQELQKLAEALVLLSERQAADRKELTAQYDATIPEGDEITTSGM